MRSYSYEPPDVAACTRHLTWVLDIVCLYTLACAACVGNLYGNGQDHVFVTSQVNSCVEDLYLHPNSGHQASLFLDIARPADVRRRP